MAVAPLLEGVVVVRLGLAGATLVFALHADDGVSLGAAKAVHVQAPTTPSAVSKWIFWKLTTFALVAGPKLPSWLRSRSFWR